MKRKHIIVSIIISFLILISLLGIGAAYYIKIQDNSPKTEERYDSDYLITDESNIKEDEPPEETIIETDQLKEQNNIDISFPEYNGEAFCVINDNIPYFTEDDKQTTEPFEYYSGLDSLGRCGVAYANVCDELMPVEPRGEIGNYKPSGWQTVKYNEIIDGNYLYNRCHLIGYQLTGENDNILNLITGTRYLNVVGMLPFENKIADYVSATHNHVLYRVTPIFLEDNLVASGVQMEAWSVEDCGQGICFHVFCYNVQPGIEIDYKTGDSWLESVSKNDLQDNQTITQGEINQYILNTNSHRIHKPDCDSVNDIAEHNKKEFEGTLDVLIRQDFVPCHVCFSEYYE